MTGDGSKYAQALFTFPAAQEEALSLWQWSKLETWWEGTQRGWKKLVDVLEGRKVGGTVPPQF